MTVIFAVIWLIAYILFGEPSKIHSPSGWWLVTLILVIGAALLEQMYHDRRN